MVRKMRYAAAALVIGLSLPLAANATYYQNDFATTFNFFGYYDELYLNPTSGYASSIKTSYYSKLSDIDSLTSGSLDTYTKSNSISYSANGWDLTITSGHSAVRDGFSGSQIAYSSLGLGVGSYVGSAVANFNTTLNGYYYEQLNLTFNKAVALSHIQLSGWTAGDSFIISDGTTSQTISYLSQLGITESTNINNVGSYLFDFDLTKIFGASFKMASSYTITAVSGDFHLAGLTVPEPESYAYMLTGLAVAGVAGLKRRRKNTSAH